MAGKLFIIGRVLFFALLMAQCSLLVKNVVNYDGNNIYWLLALCFLPGIITWLVVMKTNNGREMFVYLVSILQTNSNGHCARCALCDSRFNIRRKSTK